LHNKTTAKKLSLFVHILFQSLVVESLFLIIFCKNSQLRYCDCCAKRTTEQ